MPPRSERERVRGDFYRIKSFRIASHHLLWWASPIADSSVKPFAEKSKHGFDSNRELVSAIESYLATISLLRSGRVGCIHIIWFAVVKFICRHTRWCYFVAGTWKFECKEVLLEALLDILLEVLLAWLGWTLLIFDIRYLLFSSMHWVTSSLKKYSRWQ